jgi:cyclase
MRMGFAIVFLGLAPLPALADNLQVEAMADGVYALRPTDEAFDGYRAISNSAAVVLDDGVLLFDSHMTPELVEEARADLKPLTDKPVRYVVNSHYHWDHTGGNWAYAKDVEIITHLATREHLLKYYAELPTELPKEIAEEEQQVQQETDPAARQRLLAYLRMDRDLLARVAGGARAPVPTLTFDSKVVLDRGRRVEIYFLGRGHTDGDTVVYLPAEKIALLGDLLFTKALPNIRDGYTKEWIATLEKVLALGATRFLPGHGPLSTADDVREMIAYLVWLRGAVEPYVKSGRSLDDVKRGVVLPDAYKAYRWTRFFPTNLEKVFGELKVGQ